MRFTLRRILLLLAILSIGTFITCYNAAGQSSSGTMQGVVRDPSGAVVAGAKVEISYPISGFHRETVTGSTGEFHFTNVPFNPYHLVVTAKSFAGYSQDVDIRSAVPVAVEVKLDLE